MKANRVITMTESRIVFAAKWQVVVMSGVAIGLKGLLIPVKGGESCMTED